MREGPQDLVVSSQLAAKLLNLDKLGDAGEFKCSGFSTQSKTNFSGCSGFNVVSGGGWDACVSGTSLEVGEIVKGWIDKTLALLPKEV